MKITFLKEPGYVYDLFCIFAFYFNRQAWLPEDINDKIEDEAAVYLDKVLDDYLPIPDDLFLFFYLQEGNATFMTEYYYSKYEGSFLEGKYNLPVVLTALSDYNQVVDNILRFYFRGITEEEVKECRKSLLTFNRLVRESKYNNDVKSALYSFMIDPVPMIQRLSYELMVKDMLLEKQYASASKELKILRETFDYVQFATAVKNVPGQLIDLDGFEELFISFCYLFKDVVFCKFYGKSVLAVLGSDYINALERYALEDKNHLDLDIFGNAVSEKNRVKILDLILEQEELTVREIGQELGLTTTNAYYHLILMVKAGMLNARNRGRTVCYRINKEYFEKLIDTMKKYTE